MIWMFEIHYNGTNLTNAYGWVTLCQIDTKNSYPRGFLTKLGLTVSVAILIHSEFQHAIFMASELEPDEN